MISQQNTIRRRNGKQQACEPCRLSKQKCSHDLPFCKRCVAGNKTDKCYYHEAPMTKNFDADNPTQRQSSTSSKRALSSSSGSPPQTSSHRAKAFKESTEIPPLPSHGRLFRPAHRWGTSSSYGSTSFSAIFRENQDKFGSDIFDAPHDAALYTESSASDSLKKLNRCLKILHALPSEETCGELLNRFVTAKDPLLAMPLMSAAIGGLWDTFRQNLTAPRTEKKLEDIAEVMKTNSGTRWTCIGDPTFGEWPNICCGRRLRWEMLGLIFAYFGLAYMHLKVSDPLVEALHEPTNARQIAAWRMRHCAIMCLQTLKDLETMNEMVIILMRAVMLLDNLFFGNESKESEEQRALLVQATLSSGLYAMPKSPLITAATEYRRRIFMSVYDADKMMSCFSGLPPLIYKRHCMMQAPLDLSDDELLGGPAEIAQAASRLDANGWNTDGKIHEVTTYRALFELSKVKEDIQENALCMDPASRRTGVDELLEKLNATVATFPLQLRYKNPAPNVVGKPGAAIFAQSLLRLEYLQLKYHIERLRADRKRRTSQGLFDTAREIVEAIAHIFVCDAHVTTHWFDWLLVAYGFPAAGVLVLTATAPIRSGAFHTPSSSVPSSQPSSQLQLPPSSQISTGSSSPQPRNLSQLLAINFRPADVVELLNNFFAFLAWSREANGNQLPSQVETAMRKMTSILQQTLSHPSSQGPKSANSSFGGGFSNLYPRSANASFSSMGANGSDAIPSQYASFDLNASMTSGTVSQSNTNLTTPADGSFDGHAPLDDNSFQSELDWIIQTHPQCNEFLDTIDPTAPPMELDAPDVVENYGEFLNMPSISFGPQLGSSFGPQTQSQ